MLINLIGFKNLQFHTAPQTMSFELELKKRQEEFARTEAAYYKEISVLKIELGYDHAFNENSFYNS